MKYTSVSIPVELHKKVKEFIKGKGFKSVSDYVTFVLREILAGKKEFEEGEIELVKRRLKALGYM